MSLLGRFHLRDLRSTFSLDIQGGGGGAHTYFA